MILAAGARVVPILMELTRSIPIVTPSGTDAIERGYAGNLARPGGNVTGFGSMEVSVIGKMLQTLKEIAPNVAHVSMIYNPDNPAGPAFVRSFESAAGPLGVKPIIAHIHGPGDIERAVAAAAAQPDGGIFFPLDVTIQAFMEQTSQRLRGIVCRRSIPSVSSRRAEGWFPTARIALRYTAVPPPMLIVSCVARRLAICPSNCRRSTSW